MKLYWLLALLVFCLPASAQAPSPAQMGLDKSTATGNLSVLDRSNTWVPIGSVNSTTHTFTPSGTTSPLTLYVDNVSGVDSVSCGLTTGAGACNTIQKAFTNVCLYYNNIGGAPTVKLTAGQTYTSGVLLTQGGPTTTAASPTCSGVNTIYFDLNGATINPTNNSAIYIRSYPIKLVVYSSNATFGTLTVSGTSGLLVDARGGGAWVEFEGNVNFGAVPSLYPQIQASRSALVTTCPVGTCSTGGNYTITGGGGTFLQGILGGSVEFEGVNISINSGITYDVAFLTASDAGSTTLSGLTFSGSNVTGVQYISQKLGIIDIGAQTGSFTACPGNNYVPGSYCGQMGFVGGRFSDPGVPTVSGCGTGAVVQNSEPGNIVVLGSGLPTSGYTSSCVMTFATRSNWTACTAISNEARVVTQLGAAISGPTSTNRGSLNLYWVASSDPNGKAIYVNCTQ